MTTPEEGKHERTWGSKEAAILREMMYHESDMINHRLTWLLQIQGFLFAAIAFAWSSGIALVAVISFVGIVVSLSIWIVLLQASRAARSLEKEWDRNMVKDVEGVKGYTGPPIIAYLARKGILRLCHPWRLLPPTFALVWLVVIVLHSASTNSGSAETSEGPSPAPVATASNP